METKKKCGALGRPRTFDIEEALDKALMLFWQKGYEGTSLSDLTEAMEISRPSLYAAFGSKEELFRKALDRYALGPASYLSQALQQPTARGVAEALLTSSADQLSSPGKPHGCLFVQAALSCGDAAETVRQELVSRRAAAEAALRLRFEKAQLDGDLSTEICCADLARYISTVAQGMAVQAANGACCQELKRVKEIALSVWPEGNKPS